MKLADGRWLYYKGAGAPVLPGSPAFAENAKWKHPEGLCVIATVETDGVSGSPGGSMHVSVSHNAREISDRECTLIADALFPVGAVVEKRGEVAEFTGSDSETRACSYSGVVHLVTPLAASNLDSIPHATRQVFGHIISAVIRGL